MCRRRRGLPKLGRVLGMTRRTKKRTAVTTAGIAATYRAITKETPVLIEAAALGAATMAPGARRATQAQERLPRHTPAEGTSRSTCSSAPCLSAQKKKFNSSRDELAAIDQIICVRLLLCYCGACKDMMVCTYGKFVSATFWSKDSTILDSNRQNMTRIIMYK
jgi:hypothetical protein